MMHKRPHATTAEAYRTDELSIRADRSVASGICRVPPLLLLLLMMMMMMITHSTNAMRI